MPTILSVEYRPTEIILMTPEGTLRLQRCTLPPAFLEWQREARLRSFETMMAQDAGAVRTQPAHLPVMATFQDGLFPANLASRGMGLLPVTARLGEFTQVLEQAIAQAQGRPAAETLPERLKAIRQFYENLENLDPMQLGGLEIFEGQTATNLQRLPLASLLYSGEAPRYPSYQFNGVVEIIQPDNPYYRFLLAARELFARDAFHIHQIQYPFGYLFHVVEIKDKTPFPRRGSGKQ